MRLPAKAFPKIMAPYYSGLNAIANANISDIKIPPQTAIANKILQIIKNCANYY